MTRLETTAGAYRHNLLESATERVYLSDSDYLAMAA